MTEEDDDLFQVDDMELAPYQEQDLRIFKAITSNQRLALDFASSHTSNLFIGSAQPIADAMISYVKTYKETPTQRVLIDKNPNLASEITEIFESLSHINFDPQEYKYDLEKLLQKFKQTTVSSLADELRFNNSVDPDVILKNMESTLKKVKQHTGNAKQAYTQRGLHDYIDEFNNDYVAKIENPDLGQGILTGYSFLDHVTNGIAPAELLVIGAETSAGKSVMLNNLAIQMWMQKNTIATASENFTKGYNVLYFSLEMPFKSCFRRTMARLAEVPIYGLRDSQLTKSELESTHMASNFIRRFSEKQAQFEIVDIPRGVTVEQIEERYLEACTRFTPDVIVIDYLGLLEDHQAEGDDWLKLGFIAGKLHEFARMYNIRVLTAVQLNRPTNKSKTVDPSELIGIHRIGRSSLIMHHANVGIQIETRKDEDLRDTLVYHVIKNRDGERGKAEIKKKFSHAAIYDIPYTPPNKNDFGAYISGFEDDEDISAQIREILKIK